MTKYNARTVSEFNLPQKKLAALARYRERFVRMRPALLMVEERAKAKPENALELNLKLWDAFTTNNAAEMARLLRAGARADSIEDNIRSEERRINLGQH